MALYALALVMPAIEAAALHIHDPFVPLIGLLLMFLDPNWLAQPLACGGLICFMRGYDNMATACALAALFLGAQVALNPFAPHGFVSYFGSAAYWTWMVSIGFLAVAALFARDVAAAARTRVWWRTGLLACPVVLYGIFLVAPTTRTHHVFPPPAEGAVPEEIRVVNSGAREVIDAIGAFRPPQRMPAGILAQACFWAGLWLLIRGRPSLGCVLGLAALGCWLWYAHWLGRPRPYGSVQLLQGHSFGLGAMNALTAVAILTLCVPKLAARPS